MSSTSTTLLDLSCDYDNGWFNITNITDNKPPSQAPHYDEIASYDYTTNHYQPHAVQHDLVSGTTYTYDTSGNMTADGVRTMVYDYDNMPVSVSIVSGGTTAFVYDGNGTRVKKITPSGTTTYIGKLYECYSGTCAKYIFAGDTLLAHKASPTNIAYYHPDHQGSISAVSYLNSSATESIWYFPYGETRTGSVSLSHLYTSQELDDSTGLYNYNARFYNSSLGRFISADTYNSGLSNPQTFNRYSYVTNNPVNYTDPSGHCPCHGCCKAVDQVVDQAKRTGDQIQNQSSRTSGQIQNQSSRTSGQIQNQSSRTSGQIQNQSSRTSGQIQNQSSRTEQDARNETKRNEDTLHTIGKIAVQISTAPYNPPLLTTIVMIGFQFSPIGIMTNLAITGLEGTPRLPVLTRFEGRPIVKNSMYGYIGSQNINQAGGFTPGPVSFTSTDADAMLMMHEGGHELQFWDMDGYTMTYDWALRNNAFETDANNRATDYFGVPVHN